MNFSTQFFERALRSQDQQQKKIPAVLLSINSVKMFSEILEHKRRDCTDTDSSNRISNDKVLIEYIRQTLSKIDSNASILTDCIFSMIIKEFLDREFIQTSELQRLFSKSQIINMRELLRIPESTQSQLDKLLESHIDLIPGSFPDGNLIDYIKAKIPETANCFPSETLQDYINLTVWCRFVPEQPDSCSIEIRRKIESQRSEVEVANEILRALDKKLSCLDSAQKKISLFISIYDEFVEACEQLQQNFHKRVLGIAGIVNSQILSLIHKNLGRKKSESFWPSISRAVKFDFLENYQKESLLKSKIITQLLWLISTLECSIVEIESLDNEVKELNDSKIIEQSNQVKASIKDLFVKNDNKEIEANFLAVQQIRINSARNSKKVKEISEEIAAFRSVYELRQEKLKKLFSCRSGIKEVVESDFLEREQEMIEEERELAKNFDEIRMKNHELKACMMKAVEGYGEPKLSTTQRFIFCVIFLIFGILFKAYYLR